MIVPQSVTGWLFFSIAFTHSICAGNTIREFTSTDGEVRKAEVLNVREDSVSVRFDDKIVKWPLSTLSEEDCKFLAQWMREQKPRLRVHIQSNLSEEQKNPFQFEATVENWDSNRDLVDADATLMVLGTFSDSPKDVVLIEQIDFRSLTILVRQKVQLERTTSSKTQRTGAAYEGYLFVVRNAAGKAIRTLASEESYEAIAQQLLRMSVDDPIPVK